MKYANRTALRPKRIYIYGLLNERPKKCKSSKTAPHLTIHKTPGYRQRLAEYLCYAMKRTCKVTRNNIIVPNPHSAALFPYCTAVQRNGAV